jgi:SOS-response transcriptional repressor LexA
MARQRKCVHEVILMKGKVNDGDLVTLDPCSRENLEVGDIVLVKIRGRVYLHLIKAKSKGRFLIGNNRGGTNGWVSANSIYGVAIQIEPS